MNLSKIVEYIGLSIALAFIGMGIFIITTKMFDNLPMNYKVVFSSLLIAYGAFRLIAILLRIKDRRNDENSED